MRFCNMKGQDSIGHLEMKFIFSEVDVSAAAARPRLILQRSTARLETRSFKTAARIDLLMSTLTVTGVPASRRSQGSTHSPVGLLLIVVLLPAGAAAYAYFSGPLCPAPA